MPLGERPRVEHAVPVDGVAMLPVTVGAGLMPGEGSSVAPRPIPTGEIDDPVLLPSGEVVPTVGVGRAIPVTCASAPPLAKKARQAATRQYLTESSMADEAGALNLSMTGRMPLRFCTIIA